MIYPSNRQVCTIYPPQNHQGRFTPQIAKYDLPPPPNRPILSKISDTQHHALLHKGLFCERPIKHRGVEADEWGDRTIYLYSWIIDRSLKRKSSVISMLLTHRDKKNLKRLTTRVFPRGTVLFRIISLNITIYFMHLMVVWRLSTFSNTGYS